MLLCTLISYWAQVVIPQRGVHIVSVLMLFYIFLLLIKSIFRWRVFGFFFWWEFTWWTFLSTLGIRRGSIAIIGIPLLLLFTIKRPSIPPGFFPDFLQLIFMQLDRLFDLSIFEKIFLWLIIRLRWFSQYPLCWFRL